MKRPKNKLFVDHAAQKENELEQGRGHLPAIRIRFLKLQIQPGTKGATL